MLYVDGSSNCTPGRYQQCDPNSRKEAWELEDFFCCIIYGDVPVGQSILRIIGMFRTLSTDIP